MEEKHIPDVPLYTPTDFYMLRTSALSSDIFTSLLDAVHIFQEGAPQTLDAMFCTQQKYSRQKLQELVAQPQIKLAIAVASSSLLEEVERSRDDDRSPKHTARMYASLLRYIIRMSTRPTPFGIFAGITCGTFAEKTTVLLASPPVSLFRTKPDMNWVLAVLQKIEEVPELVTQLKVNTNQTVYVAGERFILPVADVYGQQDDRSISLHGTAVVRKVFEYASQPILYSKLCDTLLQLFPNATKQKVNQLLWQLWENHFLISDLHPPLTDTRATSYIYNYLSNIQGTEDLQDKLHAVLTKMSDLDGAGTSAPVAYVQDLIRSQKQLVPGNNGQPPFQVDAAIHLKESLLNISIGKAAARVAELFLRQSIVPEGLPKIREYRYKFLAKYGQDAEVPLLDLLSPEKGLDVLSSYNHPSKIDRQPSDEQLDHARERDRILQVLVTEAINNRSLEIELTETHLQRLQRWSPQIEQAPLSLEVYLQIHASSRDALDRGEWSAVVSPMPGSPAGGRTFGRFFDLLDEVSKEALQQFIKSEESLYPYALFAEFSYQPQMARLANVATRPLLRSYEIVVGTTPTVPVERVIPLDDLVVGIQNGRFYLRSLSRGKQVIVCQNHMLSISQAPNICRFIADLMQDGRPGFSGFDWGTVSNSPFLPRVVVRENSTSTLVLKPASWTLYTNTLMPVGDGSAEVRWFQGVQQWREQWRVPRYVYFTEFDNRLLLDLTHPMMVSELLNKVSKLNRDSQVILQELLPDFEHLWLHDEQGGAYFAEITVPLLRSDAVEPKTNSMQSFVRKTSLVITQKERSFFPGDSWVFFKLYSTHKQLDEIIANPLRRIVQTLQEQNMLDYWFFIRFNDPEPHLRLRLHAKSPQVIQSLFAIVMQWCRQLVERETIQRYTIDTYEREVERYGGPQAIELAEQIFCIDSETVSSIIAAQQMKHLSLDPMAVAVFTIDHFFSSWGLNFDQRLQWLRKNFGEKYSQSKAFRPHRKLYCELLSPWTTKPNPDLTDQRTLLLTLVKHQEIPLANFARQIRLLAETKELWVEENSLLQSLAHMHKIRLLGLDHRQEEQMYAFWLHTLESIRLRPTQRL